MPVAGEEGYEESVICPYDRSHEIRRGRLQFHLDKCRKNYPNVDVVQCPFNSTHLIPKVEEQYHTEEECQSRSMWDRALYEVGDPNCPVKDLVPVTAGTLPDADENWDDFESQGSVLNTIKAEAAEKKIFRMLQCESKAKRKEFREQERLRHLALSEVKFPETSTQTYESKPLRRPSRQINVPIKRQDPQEAVAAISKQFRTLDLKLKSDALSDSSSVLNESPCTIAADCQPSTSTRPSSAMSSAVSTSSRIYTAAESPPTIAAEGQPSTSTRPSSAISSAVSTSSQIYTAAESPPTIAAEGQPGTSTRPSSAMSSAVSTSSQYTDAESPSINAAESQPSTSTRSSPAMSSAISTSSRMYTADESPSTIATESYPSTSTRPSTAMSSAISTSSRMSTAASIAASVKRFNQMKQEPEEVFCSYPIPGLGRGLRRKGKL